MTSPWREIQAAEPATLPTRWLARNAPKQACFGYNGTQDGGCVAQVLGAPYAELDEKLASDVKEINKGSNSSQRIFEHGVLLSQNRHYQL
jgi:hypothetical protein